MDYRTFIAVEIPREIRVRVVEHISRLRREAPDVRASWGREDNLHLTIKFLGNVPLADIPKVSNAVGQSSAPISRFELVLSECGSFPPHGRPKVLWIGAQAASAGIAPASSVGKGASSLHLLNERIEDSLGALGFPRETRPFHPHLTIARLRSPQGARGLAELHQRHGFGPEAFTVSEVIVFRSELLKEGSKHTPISRHLLQ